MLTKEVNDTTIRRIDAAQAEAARAVRLVAQRRAMAVYWRFQYEERERRMEEILFHSLFARPSWVDLI